MGFFGQLLVLTASYQASTWPCTGPPCVYSPGDHPGAGDVRRDAVARQALLDEVARRAAMETVKRSTSGATDMKAALADAHNSIAVQLMERNRFRDAEPEVRQALELLPTKPELSYNLGVVLSGLKRYSEAETAYEQALSFQAEFPSAHFNLARTHMSLANSIADEGCFDDAKQRNERLVKALWHLNHSFDHQSHAKSLEQTYKSMEEVHYQLGDAKGAWNAYQRFLAIAPQEGLQSTLKDSCSSIIAWLEDRLLELPGLDGDSNGAYPTIPSSVQAELCDDEQAGNIKSPRSQLQRRFFKRSYARFQQNQTPYSDASLAFFAAYFLAVHKAGGFYKDSKDDPTALLSAGRWSLDNDRLAVFLAHTFRNLVEEVAGKRMKLGFAKVAIYEQGAELPNHHDQILNEVSITLVLQSTAGGVASAKWPLVLWSVLDVEQNYLQNVSLVAPVGGGLVFRGRDFLHGRPCCLPEGESSTVLLLHYVADEFPEYQCRTLVNVTGASAADLLQHACAQLPSTHSASIKPNEGVEEDLQAASKDSRYLLYNPCATNLDPTYCQSQFNNQVVFLLHALSVARALGRTLVLPPFMWMEHQMAEVQNWFPFEHFFDVDHLAQRFDVISLEDFLSRHKLQQPGGFKLLWYYYPPYLVSDEPNAYQGRFFRNYMNLSFAWPKRMSPFWEVRMAASGRGEEPYKEGEGKAYWTAARLLLGKFRAESSNFHENANSAAASTFAEWLGFIGGPSRIRTGGEEEARLINNHASELVQWTQLARTLSLGKDLHPVDDLQRYRQGSNAMNIAALDVLVFDFAPSYNFRFDRFDFDWELRRNRRALRFRQDLERSADEIVAQLFGGQRFVALHLRRDGYAEFCRAEALREAAGFGKLRFGFRTTQGACNPSEEDLLWALSEAGVGHSNGAHAVFLSTNSQDPGEIESLRRRISDEFGASTHQLHQATSSGAIRPEHRPALDLLVAARAWGFIGNPISTLSMNVLIERDVRGLPRNSTTFCGLGKHEIWAGQISKDAMVSTAWIPLSRATVSQSSTAFGGDAEHAVDGVADPEYINGHCTHTIEQRTPWWKADLGMHQMVQFVEVMNRGDCCEDRLSGLEVWISKRSAQLYRQGRRCAVMDNPILAGETRTLRCNVAGSMLWLVLPGHDRVLTLCSVRVALGPSSSNLDLK